MLRVAKGQGSAIAVEVWAMPPEPFGRFTAAIPPPLSIGSVRVRPGGAGEVNSLRTGKITANSRNFAPIWSGPTSICVQVLRLIGNSLLQPNRDFLFRNSERFGRSGNLQGPSGAYFDQLDHP